MSTPPPARRPIAPRPVGSRPAAGRTLQSLMGPLQRGLHRIDDHLLQLLDAPCAAAQRPIVCLEVDLLLRLRRSLVHYLRPAVAPGDGERIDVVLADGLLEAVDAAVAAVADLTGPLEGRALRWSSFCRELLAELAALGAADVTGLRARCVRASKQAEAEASLSAAAGAALTRELGALYAALRAQLEATSPLRAPTVLDEALASLQAGH